MRGGAHREISQQCGNDNLPKQPNHSITKQRWKGRRETRTQQPLREEDTRIRTVNLDCACRVSMPSHVYLESNLITLPCVAIQRLVRPKSGWNYAADSKQEK